MASDIKLNDSSVILEGKVGIGTSNPEGNLHIVGSGPITIENPNGESDITFKSGNLQSWQVGTNNKGWYVWDNDYRLVIRPGGEIRSGGSGSGFSFNDRTKSGFVDNPTDGERWVWYAHDGNARLWSGEDVLIIRNRGHVIAKALTVNSDLHVDNRLWVGQKLIVNEKGYIQGKLEGHVSSDSPRQKSVRCTASAISLDHPDSLTGGDRRFALVHDFEQAQKDGLVINYQGSYKDGVKIEGNVQVTGNLTQASSIALKENVAELSGQEAMATLQGLNAVKYNYKADEQKEQRIGFIAEEVPDLVANSERDRLSPMDIVAVLTKAMQEQQRIMQEQQQTIAELVEEVGALKAQNKF